MDQEDSKWFKLIYNAYLRINNNPEEARKYTHDKIAEMQENILKFPSPAYVWCDEFEVGQVYHVASGLSHPTFRICEKLPSTEEDFELCVYQMVRFAGSNANESYYTQKHDMSQLGAITARFGKGPWGPMLCNEIILN